jgi:hypothetical protein
MAVIPASLAALELARGTLAAGGVVRVDRQVAESPLRAALTQHGIAVVPLAGVERSQVE